MKKLSIKGLTTVTITLAIISLILEMTAHYNITFFTTILTVLFGYKLANKVGNEYEVE